MTAEKIDGFWFAAADRLPHGDNRPIVLDETHSVSGAIVLCANALHASRDPFDALSYAPGPFLYRVRCWGDVVEDNEKLGARNREYIAMRNATDVLRQFARRQALSVIHLWPAPEIVRTHLETGDEALREAAWDAASAASWAAASAAARDAARNASWAAASAAARNAASAASWEAARDAASAASWAAASAAARDAARNAAWDAAWAAASAASWAAASAAARDAAWDAARTQFNEMVAEMFLGSAP